MRRLWHLIGTYPRAVLVCTVALVFGPGVTGYFFNDAFGIVPWCMEVPLSTVLGLVDSPAQYRLVMTLSSWFQAQLFGAWAGGYLLVGVVAYAGTVLLVHRCLLRCGAQPAVAVLGAAVFALMPLNHQQVYFLNRAVDYFWAAAAIWCLTHPGGRERWWLGLVGALLLGLGLWSYELNLSAGAAVLAIAVAMRPREQPLRLRALARPLLPAVLVTGMYALNRFVVAGNLSFYHDVTGATDSVLAASPAVVLQRVVHTLYYAIMSRTHLLRPAEYPVLWVVTAAAPLLAILLTLLPMAPRPGRRVGLALALWAVGTLVPVLDFVNQVNAESRHLFWLNWALVTALVLYAPGPDTSRSSGSLWALLMLVMAGASIAEAGQWRTIHGLARCAVTSFAGYLPQPPRPTRVYLLDLPGVFLGERVFSPASTAMTLPVPPTERHWYAVHEQRALPHDPPLEVSSVVPSEDAWPVIVLRWHDAGWRQEPVPTWARPAPLTADDIGLWTGERLWAAQGWTPNPHLVPVRADAPGEWFRTESRFSVLTGPVLRAGDVPVAWAVVTMTVRAARTHTYADWLFVTATDPEWDPRKVIRFRILADGQPHTYAVPILAHPRSVLEGPVTRLALRPAGAPHALVQIDRIRVVPLRSADGRAGGPDRAARVGTVPTGLAASPSPMRVAVHAPAL